MITYSNYYYCAKMGGNYSRRENIQEHSKSGQVFLVMEYDGNNMTGYFKIAKAYEKIMGEEWGQNQVMYSMQKGNPRVISIHPDASFHVKDAKLVLHNIRQQVLRLAGVSQREHRGHWFFIADDQEDPIPKIIDIMQKSSNSND